MPIETTAASARFAAGLDGCLIQQRRLFAELNRLLRAFVDDGRTPPKDLVDLKAAYNLQFAMISQGR